MKSSHFKTPRTQDECVYTYPNPIEHYVAPGHHAIRWLAGILAVCLAGGFALVASGVIQ